MKLNRFDGYDDCIIGLSEKPLIVYNYDKIIAKLILSHGMDQEEAVDYYSHNMACLHQEEEAPIVITMASIEDIDEIS
jgi:hypothetical protein